MAYEHLSDEDKIYEAIRFVARGVTLPRQLETFLKEQHIYELIVNPQEIDDDDSQRTCSGHISGLPREA